MKLVWIFQSRSQNVWLVWMRRSWCRTASWRLSCHSSVTRSTRPWAASIEQRANFVRCRTDQGIQIGYVWEMVEKILPPVNHGLSARLWYLRCVSDGDTSVLSWTIKMICYWFESGNTCQYHRACYAISFFNIENTSKGIARMNISLFQARELSERLSSERAAWAREQAALTMQLHAAEKEALRLKNEQRHLEIQLEREREKYFQTPGASVPADKEKVRSNDSYFITLDQIKSVSCMMMPCPLMLPGHHYPWYWWCEVGCYNIYQQYEL